ncbi:malate synthase [Ornithinibacillus halotolerans]|uniref:Malate synthase n=1 Tax=Ornithinibacillus halotolerans TaxID=1274357 RepID=A0A916W591_9BACI|nr:malate synthase [Ornithinibacillus halotolerans]GGA67624.1 hypothetical protein GCM10008025_09320 [Ornithinibacillus halotolerans]
MNLVNKKVTHKRFGTGNIVGHDDSIIEIHFGEEQKKFIFPDVFGNHLKLHDEKAASSLEKVIQKQEIERKKIEWQKRKEKELRLKEQQLRMEHAKLMKNHKLHPQSQMVFWCDEEERNSALTDWQVFSGVIKSGNNKGKPNKPIRLHQNSAVLLTEVNPKTPEKDRRILGVYMVKEEFIGKICEDGMIPAHSVYKLKLTEEEANQMLFWKYYINEKYPEKTTWNTGKYRYFDNLWMAQILADIVSMKKETEERELAEKFLSHFCALNRIKEEEIPEPNGVLMRA